MADGTLSLSNQFEDATEADWLAAVGKALKGGGIERITRENRDGIKIHPLYRETDFESGSNPRGVPGEAPYLRGPTDTPARYLPWDIRQAFSHPDPATTNLEVLRDLERGATSIHLEIECSGTAGCIITNQDQLSTALSGVRADLATVSLGHLGAGSGTSAAGLLALWADAQDAPNDLKLAFNISPIRQLMVTGQITGGVDAAMNKTAAMVSALSGKFPNATSLEVEAQSVHEAGGSEGQELGALMAGAVDLLRRLDTAGISPSDAPSQILFKLAVDANYGIGIAKLRAARRLWARVQEALGLDPQPMKLHAVTSSRMLTRYDAWVNMLRGTAACFAAATGGADVITVRAFNESLSRPEELGRRIARNTQIMAMEESGLGRVADPSGGAWFSETLAEDLAQVAWAEFQTIESEGGLVESLVGGHLQARVAEKRAALVKDVARRKVPVTGVSEFPLLEEISAPIADIPAPPPGDGVDPVGVETLLPNFKSEPGEDTTAEALVWMTIAAPFEALRDRAEAHLQSTGSRPSIFLATLGPVSEHTARADFARNVFAAGGLEAKTAPVPSESTAELAAAFAASGCKIAVLCGSDKRYPDEAASAAGALKKAGAVSIWLAGKFEATEIDRYIFMGADVVHELTVALAELGVK
ncbi:MAG: methylmalonyl-CoA mutase [Henriciella sp.]|nr:methylmalonyl-CoA mutase [Henriciella sp.]MBO6695918.1 methylmalonyl-CoA mutase [Henriciella sp.]